MYLDDSFFDLEEDDNFAATFLQKDCGENPDWKDVYWQNELINTAYPVPTMFPPIDTWIASFLQPCQTVGQHSTIKSSAALQLGLFNTDTPEQQKYKCSLGDFVVHDTVDTFQEVITEYIKTGTFVALDIETTGFDPYKDRIRCLQVSNDGVLAHILLVEKIGDDCREVIKSLFENCPLVLQNGVFDLSFLAVKMGVFPKHICFDTLIAAQNCDAGYFEARDKAFNLGSLSARLLNIKLDKSEQKNFSKEANAPLSLNALRYAANDPLATWRLAVVLQKRLRDKNVENTFRDLDLRCIPISVHIKVCGVPVSLEKIEKLKEKYAPLADHAKNESTKRGIPINIINSPTKLLRHFHKKHPTLLTTGEEDLCTYFLGRSIRKAKDTDIEELKSGKYPEIGWLIEYREYEKIVNGMLTGYSTKYYNEITHSVHPNLNICGSVSEIAGGIGKDVATGRFSCIAKDTLVATDKGLKTIQNIICGDVVYCYNKQSYLEKRMVLRSEKTGTKKVIRVNYFNGETKSLDCTPEHLIRLSTGKYREARLLVKGDYVLTFDEFGTDFEISQYRNNSEVLNLEYIDKIVDVYDLGIEQHHNFIAGGICVHNSNNPNMQNVGAKQDLRDVFTAPKDYLIIKTDASQQEVRILAEASGDKALRKIYTDAGKGEVDIYKETAALVMKCNVEDIDKKTRQVYKGVVLGVGYGSGAKTVASSTGVSLEEAKDAIAAYFESFPDVKAFIERSRMTASRRNELSNSFSGRKRFWDPVAMKDFEFKYNTQGANHLIQSGAADSSKRALLYAYERLSYLGCRPLVPVHDELVFLSPGKNAQKAYEILCECMIEGSEYYMKSVPMNADGSIGKTWRKENSICEFCSTEENKETPIRPVCVSGNWTTSCKECYLTNT